MPLHRLAAPVNDRRPIGCDRDQVALLETNDPTCLVHHRRDRGGEKVAILGQPDDEGRSAARADHEIWLVERDDCYGIHAAHAREREPTRLQQAHPVGVLGVAPRQLPLDQVCQNLGIGLRGEYVPLALELRPQLGKVLDGPVVDDAKPPRAIDVGMRVFVRWPAVGGPARVRDANASVRRIVRQRFGEPIQLANRLADLQVASR